jgi:hypothetical protein
VTAGIHLNIDLKSTYVVYEMACQGLPLANSFIQNLFQRYILLDLSFRWVFKFSGEFASSAQMDDLI